METIPRSFHVEIPKSLRIAAVITALLIMMMTTSSMALAKPTGDKTVRFGDPEAGSPFPPEEEHDRSHHAVDKMVPRNVVVSAGAIVTFEISPFHQVAIFEPGTTPEDIDLSPANLDNLVVPFPPFLIPDFIISAGDDAGIVDIAPPLGFLAADWEFDTTGLDPGRYLVICTTLPHFAGADMFGWVTIK